MDYIRAKQIGIQYDLSDLLSNDDLYIIDESCSYGVQNPLTTLTYTPTQSLLVLATHGPNAQLHLFGQPRTHITLPLPNTKTAIRSVHFCLDSRALFVLDTSGELSLWGLETEMGEAIAEAAAQQAGQTNKRASLGLSGGAKRPKLWCSYSPPGKVTAIEVDPVLDYCFLGLESGEVVAYDLTRERFCERWRMLNPFADRVMKSKLPKAESVKLHPRNMDLLLVAYELGVVVWSFQKGKVVECEYELLPGAQGGDVGVEGVRERRKPRCQKALWSPSGQFICAVYEDGSIVFFRGSDGVLVGSRTLKEGNIHVQKPLPPYATGSGIIQVRDPIWDIKWVTNGPNVDDTSLLVSGGDVVGEGKDGITVINFGATPVALTAGPQVWADYFARAKPRTLVTPVGTPVVEMCVIPRGSPHYGGGLDPVAVVCLLANGTLATVAYPNGETVRAAEYYHPSVAMMHGQIGEVYSRVIERNQWLKMKEAFVERPGKLAPFVVGGADVKRSMRRDEDRLVAMAAFRDGKVRIWDLGHGDEIENPGVIEVDVERVVGKDFFQTGLGITAIDMASGTGELVVGLNSGEVAVFKWGKNRYLDPATAPEPMEMGDLVKDVAFRADPELAVGLMPVCLVDEKRVSRVVKVRSSDVGFIGIAYEDGGISILDMRGPHIIYHSSVREGPADKGKRISVFKPHSSSPDASAEFITSMEFSIMLLEESEFTSLNFHYGTSLGKTHTVTLLPAQPGPCFAATYVSSLSSSASPVHSILPIESNRGLPSLATHMGLAALSEGRKHHGVLVSVSATEIRLFRPPATKGTKLSLSSKDSRFITAQTAIHRGHGTVLLTINTAGIIAAYTLPNLKEIWKTDLTAAPLNYHPAHLSEIKISPSGDIIGKTENNRVFVVNLWGTGLVLDRDERAAVMINPTLRGPNRPTITNVAWITGTAHITTEQLALILSGPPEERGPIKHGYALLPPPPPPGAMRRTDIGSQQEGEGLWASMSKALDERTKALDNVGESMNRLGDSVAGFGNEVDKFVKGSTRKAGWGLLKSKFF
ncbi:hypothetical protein BJ508DRAFT_236147 [Ascobolus immersus RN42]|uniref:Lethal giant larvae (Lgl)-like C-terminal domain-containing protein n=1 Tax=Ascobolus immersus RN42 TaxID=1160509 RepID=A0A3N4ISJ7_ASCIM|nr:hypothetical protein BJ508DRAFT_236147 [Ascobolus immersus RN42]